MLSRTFTKSFGSIPATLPRQSIVTLARFQSTTTSHNPTPNTVTENGELKIKVAPIPRPNEEPETKRRRLVYQSRKRGILESDLLLSKFADKYLSSMSYEDMVEYDTLLDEPDWDIYYWATKNYDVTPLPDKWKDSKILKMLQEMSENKDRELLRMPNLKAQNDQ